VRGEAVEHENRRLSSLGEAVITLRLPFPPSTNTIWRSMRSGPMAGRVLLSKAGREYRKAVHAAVTAQNGARGAIAGRVRVFIELHPPTRRSLDIDNRIKAVLDALTHAAVWVDDEQVDVLQITRRDIVAGGLAVVEVEEIQ
jgi:crossover junction endodeoxyribonuclease RusA